ncbi:efflux RND transporter periplasmic adaptor subunit [Pacificispira sp.]|uniref:efflux RND transporter periplasmic adaptor subunit n=1 Tax=Pacificispira sp. TaxID=2888761 RepID=UPI003BAC84C5
MKFPIKPSYLIAFALAAGSAGWIYSGQMEEDPLADPQAETAEQQAQEPAAETKALPSVRVAESRATDHRAILLYTGRTEADRRAVLRAETEGRVIEVGASVSDPVATGKVIAKLATNDRYAKLKQAESLVRQREIEYEAARQLAGKGFQTESKKAEAEANLSSARASLEEIRVDLGRTTIEAPFDGVIETRSVEVGDYVQVGDEIAVIADFDPIVVTIQVSEREISRVDAGVTAEIQMLDGQTHFGLVSRIAPTADSATRTFEVELEVANQGDGLLDGMTAKVFLPAQEVSAHRITPALLALSDDGAVGVKAVDAQNKVVFYPIEIVEDTAGAMWVSGLPETVTLITVGQAYVAPGATVRPVPEDEAEKPYSEQPGASQTLSSVPAGDPS